MGASYPSVRILLVDDDPEIAKVIHDCLLDLGIHKVDICSTVADAYNIAVKRIREKQPIDMVITDFKMPKATGMDLLHQLRKNDFLRNCPIIFVTGAASEPFVVEAAKFPKVDFVTKPFSNEVLIARINRALSSLVDSKPGE